MRGHGLFDGMGCAGAPDGPNGSCWGAARTARRFCANRGGSIAIIAAASMLMLIGVAAMALDLANIFLTRSVDQRIADQSALTAAFAYSQSGSDPTVAGKAASSLAVANGAGSATVNTTFVASPSSNGSRAAKVVVTSTVPLSPFGRAISAAGVLSVKVSATSYAEIHTSVPCLIALGSRGITATGGVSVTSTGCALGSNGSIIAMSGAKITAQSMTAVGTIGAPNNDGASVKTSPTATGETFPNSSAQTDTFNATAVFSRIATVAAMTAPSVSLGNPPSGGSALTCTKTLTVSPGNYGSIKIGSACSAITFTGGTTNISGALSLSSSTPALTFNTGTYNLGGGLSFSNSNAVTLNVSGTVAFNIWNGIKVSNCGAVTIKGPASYTVAGGITEGGCGVLIFKNTNGTGTSTFQVAGGMSLSGSSATFPDGSYTIGNTNGTGLNISGGSNAVFGNGSFIISGTTGGINVGRGATLTLGSRLGAGSVFEITGAAASSGYAIVTGGGSMLTLGEFSNFDIDGSVNFGSSVSLGAGIYTINGALGACASGGAISGTGVSIITAGTICFGGGFNSIDLTAPTTIDSGTAGSVSTIALASESASASTVEAGASSTVVAGAVYIPYAALTLNGAGNLNGGGGCLEILASSLSFSGGNGLSTNCSNLSGSSSVTSVTLVQ